MKSLIYTCLLALLIEVVMPAPGVFDFEEIALRESTNCHNKCSECQHLMGYRFQPILCIKGCKVEANGTPAAIMWTVCKLARKGQLSAAIRLAINTFNEGG